MGIMCAPVLDKRGGMFIRGEIWMSAIVDEGAKLYTPLFASLAADGICAAQWTPASTQKHRGMVVDPKRGADE